MLLKEWDVPGEKRPSRVRADVTVNLSVRNEIKTEWENLRKHDVCFLITVHPTASIGKIHLVK
jgi:intron-binding protein aquarius